jgi:hypothetical protein
MSGSVLTPMIGRLACVLALCAVVIMPLMTG